MTITATLKITKNKEKANITASVTPKQDGSFKSWNFTGNLVELNGYKTKDGKNYDDVLVSIDCPTTVIIFNQTQGEAIYNRCGEIFEERAAAGDINPAIDLELEVKTVRPKETNILLLNVVKAYVNPNTQIVDSSEVVDDVIAKLKANSEKASQERKQTAAARNGLSSIVNKVVKTYL